MRAKMSRQLRVAVTEAVHIEIDKAAEKLELNRSDVVRESIAAYLKQLNQSNPNSISNPIVGI